MSTEQRVDQRVRHELPISVVRIGAVEPTTTYEVSYRGLFVRMAAAPPVRELIKLQIELPTRELIAHAVVARIVGADARGLLGVGLRFFAFGDGDKRDWESYVAGLLYGCQRAA